MPLDFKFETLILCLGCFKIWSATSMNSLAGPFTVYIDRFVTCPGWSSAEGDNCLTFHSSRMSHWNPAQPNKLQLLTGNATIHGMDFDDNYWAEVILDTWSNNEWKPNAFVMKFRNGACSALRTHAPPLFESLFKGDSKGKGPCLIQKGDYVFEKVPLNFTFPNVRVLFYGYYRYTIKIGRTRKAACVCMNTNVHIVPKVQNS